MSGLLRLGSRVLVVAPHLDDAALSLGAAIHNATAIGGSVTVLNVFSGDPASSRPAGSWDKACGFASEAEATLVRRREESRACRFLGAIPRFLDYSDASYPHSQPTDAELGEAITPFTESHDMILVPGFPLQHPDHRRISSVIVAALGPDPRVYMYVEQPYQRDAALAIDRTRWEPLNTPFASRRAKGRACRSYRSQFFGLRNHLSWWFLVPELLSTDEFVAPVGPLPR